MTGQFASRPMTLYGISLPVRNAKLFDDVFEKACANERCMYVFSLYNTEEELISWGFRIHSRTTILGPVVEGK